MNAPTIEQQSVIDSTAEKLVVVAAAGAGKTFTLVSRYLRHVVEDGLAPSEILTITFTRKAAAEMKERIVGVLREKGLLDEAQQAETGPVSTIHSFCDRILRENALAAGLDPQFKTVEGGEFNAIVDECLRSVIADAWDLEENVRSVIERLAGESEWGSQTYSGKLTTRIKVLLEAFRSSVDLNDLAARYASAETTLREWNRVFLGRDEVPDFDSQDFRETMKAALKAYKAESGKREAESDIEEAELTSGLVILTCHVWRALEHRMQLLQRFDHDAQERMAVELVERNPQVRERLQQKFKALLVDETQDVNPWQYRLIDALGVERHLTVGDPQQSMYRFRNAVPQLFIDRMEHATTMRLTKNFRSEATILAYIDRFFGQQWGEAYRPLLQPSQGADLFTSDPDSYEGVEYWQTNSPVVDVPTATATFVKQLLGEGYKLGDIAILCTRNAQASSVSRTLATAGLRSRILGGSQDFYTRMEIRDMANMVHVLTGSTEILRLLAALHSPIIGLSLDACVRLAAQDDPFAALALLEPVAEGDADAIRLIKEWMLPLREYGDRMTAWELVAEILYATPYLASIARRPDKDQRLANVRKLQSIAASDMNVTGRQFAEALRDVHRLQHKENDAIAYDREDDAAIISTIHKAKGLEFPVVVLPYLGEWKPQVTFGRKTEVQPATGLVVLSERDIMQCGRFRLLRHCQEGQEAEREQHRNLYVAMTRAKERLCLGVLGNPQTKSLAITLISALGDKPRGVRHRMLAEGVSDPEDWE
ncbi:MAG: ATP-dependent helicase/nuclease subunit A [Fimbriimonadaceae bacterium]|nr:ATP-dependent helicase/nuclease subunit A [Fimbriimonadaceae bacterium]